MSNQTKEQCPRCKGKGGIWMTVKPIHGQSEPASDHEHYVTCPQTGCEKGEFNREAYYKSW